MSNIISKEDVKKTVTIKNGKEVVRSDILAKMFDRTHKQVLALIRKKQEFLLGNSISQKEYFIEEIHSKQGGSYSRFYLTRKGFDLIAVSLRGEKAELYRIWYIDTFHSMQKALIENKLIVETNKKDDLWLQFRKEGVEFRNKLTKAIQDTITIYRNEIEKKMNDGKYYYHYTQLIYSVLGIKIEKGINPRDILDKRLLVRLEDMEDKVADMIVKYSKDMYYKDVYVRIKSELSND